MSDEISVTELEHSIERVFDEVRRLRAERKMTLNCVDAVFEHKDSSYFIDDPKVIQPGDDKFMAVKYLAAEFKRLKEDNARLRKQNESLSSRFVEPLKIDRAIHGIVFKGGGLTVYRGPKGMSFVTDSNSPHRGGCPQYAAASSKGYQRMEHGEHCKAHQHARELAGLPTDGSSIPLVDVDQSGADESAQSPKPVGCSIIDGQLTLYYSDNDFKWANNTIGEGYWVKLHKGVVDFKPDGRWQWVPNGNAEQEGGDTRFLREREQQNDE